MKMTSTIMLSQEFFNVIVMRKQIYSCCVNAEYIFFKFFAICSKTKELVRENVKHQKNRSFCYFNITVVVT